MRLFLSIMAILIVASQLFAVRTLTGITGAITQPSAEITKGSSINATLISGGLRHLAPAFITNDYNYLRLADKPGTTLGAEMDGSSGFALNFARGHASLEYSLTYAASESLSAFGLNAKYQLAKSDFKLAIGGGYNIINPIGATADLYVAASYPVTEALTASANLGYKGVLIVGSDFYGDPAVDGTSATTFGLAAVYDFDEKLDFAADLMFGGDDTTLGLKADYAVSENFTASLGLNSGSDVGIFASAGFSF